jgi:hypothetical protein
MIKRVTNWKQSGGFNIGQHVESAHLEPSDIRICIEDYVCGISRLLRVLM